RPEVRAELGGRGADLLLERVTERVGRIRAHHERAFAGSSGADRRRGSHGGLADAALPGEQDHAHRVSLRGWAPQWMPPEAGPLLAHLDAALELLQRVLDHALRALGAQEPRYED